MIKEWLNTKRGLAIRVGVQFALICIILLVIGSLMQGKMNNLLNSLTEQEVARQTANFSLLAEERFNRELSQLALTAKFIERNPDRQEAAMQILAADKNGTFCGLLSRNRGVVYGATISRQDFRQLRDSFAGKQVVDYCAGKGLLFAVPVYNGDNVRYVLYRLYDESILTEMFGLEEYGSDSRILIRERGGNIIVAYGNFTKSDKDFFQDTAIRAGFNDVQQKLITRKSAAVYTESAHGNYFLFGADLPQTNCSLMGYIPWETMAGGVSRIYDLVLTVVSLLLLLFAAASVYMFMVQARAAESDVLRESVQAAKQASEAKSRFLASMSHEIRTPINAVLGMNELILREAHKPNIVGYAQNIAGAGQALLSIINDILDFSKIESGRMELVAAPYELSSLLHDTVMIIEPRAAKKNLALNVDVDSELPNELSGDVVRIRQIMLNLLTNAVKYTPQGQIDLTVRQALLTGDNLLLEISVADTGIGIREEDRHKLFGDFERLDRVRNNNIEGTGLGLAITHSLIMLMGGTVEVESTYGVGSTFRVRLPQKIVNHAPIGDFVAHIAERRAADIYHGNFIAPTAKILLVDDNEMNLMVAQGLLKETQVQVTTCKSGDECLSQMVAAHYDVILLDHMMPGMDGIETLHRTQNLPANKCRGVPIIALTANAVAGAKEMFLAAGFVDYLSKPVSGKKLEQMLQKYLPPEKVEERRETCDGGDENHGTLPHTPAGEPAPPCAPAADGNTSEEVLPLIDREMGLEYSNGMEELYENLLKMFCNLREEKERELETEFAAGDWQNYTVHVHALKSTAQTLGCVPLSQAAKALELAGRKLRDEDTSDGDKEESEQFIRSHHAAAMQLYDDTVQAIQSR